ncbi:MAG: hypothetical protein GX444_17840 [Myxococcales bacterium]|nr:hypothetical protein [Myxococcales bacterium]
MQWVIDNWELVVLAWGNGNYFNALINPLGLGVSAILLVLGLLIGNFRKPFLLSLFAVWVLIPLHHFTIEHTEIDVGNVTGFGGVAVFFIGVVVVVGVAAYFVFVRE